MSVADWVVVGVFLVVIVADGIRRARRNRTAEDYLLASRDVPWWAMGLSVMATQASAVTFVSTTGKGFTSGTGFVQFYYFLPLAMLVLCVTAVPYFHRARVYTAYQFLELRLGRGARVATSSTFLVLRCLSLGGILAAPAIVLSEFTGQPHGAMVLVTGAVAVAYTTFGGLKAVIATDVKQMAIMVVALVILAVLVVEALPSDISVGDAVSLADAADRIELANTSFDPKERYTIWSALLGGSIIFLAYFGTDQSQVQRYLAGRSLGHKRGALLLNAAAKVPFQLAILLLGVLIWVWSLYEPTPLDMSRRVDSDPGAEAQHRQLCLDAGVAGRAWLNDRTEPNRSRFQATVERLQSARTERNDEQANRVVPWVMRHRLPGWGITGLLLAGILAAALSSIDSELNALATVAVIDGMKLDPEDSQQTQKIVRFTRLFTLAFGGLATAFALSLEDAGAIIEVVNMIGSWFYGSLLGVFLLAWLDRGASGRGVVAGLVLGIASVFLVSQVLEVAWLWRNTVGTGVTVVAGFSLSRLFPPR